MLRRIGQTYCGRRYRWTHAAQRQRHQKGCSGIHRALAGSPTFSTLSVSTTTAQPASAFLSSLMTRLNSESPESYKFDLESDESVNGAAKECMEKMVRSIAAGEDGGSEEILRNFQDWAVSSKLGLGYLIYANKNANTDPFAKKLVSHLGASPEKLTREEVVTLCLLIYFRGMWTEEEISARLGTTQILRVITKVIETSGTSNAEVVALCLGLGKIGNLRLFDGDLRYAFYRRLVAISASSAELTDIDAMAVVNITSLLGRHNHIQKDDLRDVVGVLKNFSTRSDLELATAIRDGISKI